MIKKIYTISGFDCPSCAAKTEMYLNKNENIEYARLDYAANKLYLSFKNEELSIEQILKIIHEVEDDAIVLKEFESKDINTAPKIFTKKMWILTIRLIVAVALLVVGMLLEKTSPVACFVLLTTAILISIYDVTWQVINHIIHRNNILDHNMLITIAAIGAFVLAVINNGHSMDLMEALMVVVLFQIGKIIENVATNKSKAAIMSTVSLRVESANLIKGNEIIKVTPEELRVGDYIIIKTGEMIPVDSIVIDGEAFVDTSSLNGEFVPLKVSKEDKLCSGCLIKEGTIKASVSKTYQNSTVAKIVDLINNGGEKKSKADAFIAKFAKFYTPIVVGLAVLTFLIGGLIAQNDWLGWLKIGLEVLVTGCPCAIIISVPLAYFSAIGLASKKGIIVKGANYLDELNRMGKLLTDKTGTLTEGSFNIKKIVPNKVSEEEFLEKLYAAECLSNHPIGKAICHGKDVKKLAAEQSEFQEYAGLGVETIYKDQIIIAGNYKFMEQNEVSCENIEQGGTVIHCACDGEYIGYVVLADSVKTTAPQMIELLHKEGVEMVLLTGDKENNAKQTCSELNIDRYHAELMPEEKVNILEEEMKDYKKAVAFIGDGINDAPSIIRSDIGIAMGGIGSDIAVENADLVIMNDDPAKVYDAKKIAKMARNTATFNIAFSLSIKLLTFLAILIWGSRFHGMMTIAVGADTGLTVLMVLNSLLLLYRKVNRK